MRKGKKGGVQGTIKQPPPEYSSNDRSSVQIQNNQLPIHSSPEEKTNQTPSIERFFSPHGLPCLEERIVIDGDNELAIMVGPFI
jgi:hypothetical protein